MSTVTSDSVVVSRESVESSDPYDVVYSNICFVNSLIEEHAKFEEIPRDALLSYYVDYYNAQVNNGGFSQFVYNSRWDGDIVARVRQGLAAMNAPRNLQLFDRGAQLVKDLGRIGLKAYLASDYFGENDEPRDLLNAINDDFFKLCKEEDLVEHNAAWLRALPDLVELPQAEVDAEVKRRAAAIPDVAERMAAARAQEPRYVKLIRALCEHAGHKLDRVTAGDPASPREGRPTITWHFLTDQGHHYMVEADGKATLFKGDSKAPICEIDAPPEKRRPGVSLSRQVSRTLVLLSWGIVITSLALGLTELTTKAAVIAVVLSIAYWAVITQED